MHETKNAQHKKFHKYETKTSGILMLTSIPIFGQSVLSLILLNFKIETIFFALLNPEQDLK